MKHRFPTLIAVAATTLAIVLGACGIEPQDSPSADAGPSEPTGATSAATASSAPTSAAVGGGEPEDQLNFANWPLYIDQDDEGNSPTIQQFQEATGVQVTYTEAIEDNQSFFGVIQPPLAAGQDTGYDIIVVTDWMIGNMASLGYLEEIDVERDVPNFVDNADPKYQERSYDPGNLYSVPWQSGITGIAYNPELVEEEITSLAQLFDPAFIEKYCGQIGMFTEMRDSMSLALLYNGVEPADATIEDAEAAQQTLLDQASCVRDYYGNEYTDPFQNGNLAITMAWSGDVFQMQFDNPDLQFVVPEEGAVLWVDNMCIPKGAEHPNDALAMMDWVYDPDAAAQMTEWINYICPVPAAKDILLEAGDKYLEDVANSPLVFPTPEMEARLHHYRDLDEEEEQVWNDLFGQVIQG